MKEESIRKVLLESLLENTHESLKWAWQIIMGFSMVAAVQSCYDPFIKAIGYLHVTPVVSTAQSVHTLSNALLSLSLFLFVFIPTFVRFFYGDNRYLDLHYLELTRLAETKGAPDYLCELKQFTGGRRMTDILLLMSHGMLFVFLGKAVATPETFVLIYAFLLAANVFWLWNTLRTDRRVEKVREQCPPQGPSSKLVGMVEKELIRYPARDFAPKFWIKNNIFALVWFIIVFLTYRLFGYLSVPQFVIICIVIFSANSVTDLAKTWYFYFPDFADIYEGPGDSANADGQS